MIDKARELTRMMGYSSIDETLDAIGQGELILVKVPDDLRVSMVRWLRGQLEDVQDQALRSALDDIADSIDISAELQRYPTDTDVCDMELPNGWPSYCDKDL